MLEVCKENLDRVYSALMSMRAPVVMSEHTLHELALTTLKNSGIEAIHEVLISPGCRIDILAGDIGIEIKRGRPNKKILLEQLKKYATSDGIGAIILITEKSVSMPDKINRKPLKTIALNRLWGIAAPTVHVKNDIDYDMAFSADETTSEQQALKEEKANESIDENIYVDNTLPSYLLEPINTGRVYGKLSYNRRRKCWAITGEPYVTELAKRLFPGSGKARRGTAYLPDHPRSIGDCNWLMQKYPLEIAERDRELWESRMEAARQREIRLRFLHSGLKHVSPKEGSFIGKLMPFQKEGATWLYHTQRGLLADEMGLGKTVQALYTMAALKIFPVLIVVPAHLVRNWESEIQRFLKLDGKTPRVHIIKGLTPYKLPEADIYIVHYLLLRGWKEALPMHAFPFVIFDEIQELRHSGTEKYSSASLISSKADRVIGLSGTPIYNNGGEIWNIVNILDYHFLGDRESFTREWCFGYGNNIVAKPELLGGFLRQEGLMLRRTKTEVLPELPEKRRLVQHIDTDNQVYQALMQPVIDNIIKWHRETELSPSERALLEGNISQGQRQATGIAKAAYVAQFVKALLESGEKVLLFAHHHAVMDIYKKELKRYSPVFITGRENDTQKQRSIDRFTEGRSDICCISLRAASGLNLQRASCVVFGELDWSPAIHSQAEDRAHRIGQKDSLLCYYLVAKEGNDADIQDALGLKVSQFMGLMGEKPADEVRETNLANLAHNHAMRIIEKYLSSAGEKAV